MNKNKFSFIICTNSKQYFSECTYYINRLVIPNGFEVDIFEVSDADSMAAGYNDGMAATDASYKIYMHQDVFIVYPYFLQAVLDIFGSDDKIGMIGMVGSEKLPADGVMWHGFRCGSIYIKGDTPDTDYRYSIQDGLTDAEAVDGLMMITSKDIPWREDLFDGWDFYDASQSFEMKRNGYRVVVPEQRVPWCLHDDGILNMKQYNKYRQICLKEYAEFFKI